MQAYLFVIVPLALYLVAFSVETVASFRRLQGGGAYINATWEVTHTLLVLALTNFTWLFSVGMVQIGRAAYWGLIVAAAAFVVRAVLYVYLFYGSHTKRRCMADWLFALAHVVMLVGLVCAAAAAFATVAQYNYPINDQFIPYMWPGLALTLLLCAMPVWVSYVSYKKH